MGTFGCDSITPIPLEQAIDTCLALLETQVVIPDDVPVIYKSPHCYRCGKPFYYHTSPGYFGANTPFSEDELKILGRWAAVLEDDYSQTAKTTYLMWHCPHCHAKQGDFYLLQAQSGVESRVLIDGQLIPDIRGLITLWDQVKVMVGVKVRRPDKILVPIMNLDDLLKAMMPRSSGESRRNTSYRSPQDDVAKRDPVLPW